MATTPRTKFIFSAIAFILLIACKDRDKSAEGIVAGKTNQAAAPSTSAQPMDEARVENIQSHFDSGVYCADVKYYNKITGTKSTYVLNVEVGDGRLIKIKFPNGGWMDDTHFTPPLLSEKGFAEFINDKGYKYDIMIRHGGKCRSDETTIKKN